MYRSSNKRNTEMLIKIPWQRCAFQIFLRLNAVLLSTAKTFWQHRESYHDAKCLDWKNICKLQLNKIFDFRIYYPSI